MNMSSMKLVHAPVWVLFKKVQQELWSTLGFSTIASAVGFPVHSEFADLKPYTNGVIKLRVVIELAKKRPSTARVTDKFGNSVLVGVEFPKLPPRCARCKDFGHLDMRCLIPPRHQGRKKPLVLPVIPASEEVCPSPRTKFRGRRNIVGNYWWRFVFPLYSSEHDP